MSYSLDHQARKSFVGHFIFIGRSAGGVWGEKADRWVEDGKVCDGRLDDHAARMGKVQG